MDTTRRASQPLRAHQAPLASTHHPLLQPPHSQLQTRLLQHPHLISPRLWRRAQALLACLPTLPVVWTHPQLRLQKQQLPVSQWPPVLRRAGMRRIITILYPLRQHMWMFLGMQPWVG